MNNIEKVLMERDGMSSTEAKEHLSSIKNDFNSILENGGSYDEVEDLLLSEGFEMDYLFDLL